MRNPWNSRRMAGLLLAAAASLWAQPNPPEQPRSGPGGADYHYQVRETVHGEGERQFWIFEPEPRVRRAPVVAFLHGWTAMDPHPYRPWIEHLVKRGNIVVYPRYQDSIREQPKDMIRNAVDALARAFEVLGSQADRSGFAVVGHSLGGMLTFNVAGSWRQAGLPPPRAVFSVEPGDSRNPRMPGASRFPSMMDPATFAQIPSDALVVVMAGEDDRVVAEDTARNLWNTIDHIPRRNKAYVVVRTDRHGNPPLIADHFAPVGAGRNAEGNERLDDSRSGRGRMGQRRGGILLRRRAARNTERPRAGVDALDYYVFWATLDRLIDRAFGAGGRLRAAVGGPLVEAEFGRWSDDTPIKPMLVK